MSSRARALSRLAKRVLGSAGISPCSTCNYLRACSQGRVQWQRATASFVARTRDVKNESEDEERSPLEVSRELNDQLAI